MVTVEIPHLKPRDVGLGWGVHDADDLGLVALPGVDERLLLLDLGSVWNGNRIFWIHVNSFKIKNKKCLSDRLIYKSAAPWPSPLFISKLEGAALRLPILPSAEPNTSAFSSLRKSSKLFHLTCSFNGGSKRPQRSHFLVCYEDETNDFNYHHASSPRRTKAFLILHRQLWISYLRYLQAKTFLPLLWTKSPVDADRIF